jgi:hypothetical protein
MTTAYTSLLGLALPVTGELSGTWGDTVNTAITSLLDTAVAGTTSITTDADITLSTTTGASNEARQAIILWNPASGTTTRNITAPAQSKLYTVINASGGTQSIVIRGVGPTTGVTIAKGESAQVAWNGSDFVKVGSSGGAVTFTNLTVTGNTILGDVAADTLTVNATSTFAAPVSFQGLVSLPSTGRSAAAALTVTAPAFLYGVASTYTDTTSSGTVAAMAPFYSIARPTLSTSNVTTYTNAATLYIANAPATSGSATITNPFALYVDSGANYFGGAVSLGSTLGVTGAVTLSGTANGVMFLNGSKQITTGTALTFDGTALASSGSGTQSLTVTSTATAAFLQTTGANTVNARLQSNATTASVGTTSSHDFLIQTNATTVGTFDTIGNFGLGTTATNIATYRVLAIGVGSGGQGGILQFQGASGADGAHVRMDRSGSTITGFNIETRSGSNAPISLLTNSITAVTIDTYQNVGIGTASPTSRLHVNHPTASTNAIAQFTNGTTGSAAGNGLYVGIDSTNKATIFNFYNSALQFGTNGTAKMTLQSSGTLSIGNSIDYGGIMLTPPAGSYAEGLIINPASSGYSGVYLRVEAAQGASYTGCWVLGKNAASTTGGEALSIIKENLTGSTNFRVDAPMTWTTGGNTLVGYNLGVGVTAPTAKLQVAGTATNGVPFIRYDVTSENSGFNWVDTSFASNMTANTNLITFIGREGNSKNSAYFGFKYVGAASNSNLVTLGLYGIDNILNVNGTGNVSLYQATTTANGIGITFPSSQ